VVRFNDQKPEGDSSSSIFALNLPPYVGGVSVILEAHPTPTIGDPR
jgi:hypothetical protein